MPATNADTSMTEETESLLTTVPLDIENGGGAKSAPLPPTPPAPQSARADALRLLFGAGGIYAAFLYYGSLQEDVFRYTSKDGTSFDQAWYLQFLEAMANVCVGFVGMKVAGSTKNIPQKFFIISGASQVSSKAFTSLSLARGLSFPVATLAKSGKMAPVMAGQLLLGGASYSTREYLQVAAIIGGTAILSMGKKVRERCRAVRIGFVVVDNGGGCSRLDRNSYFWCSNVHTMALLDFEELSLSAIFSHTLVNSRSLAGNAERRNVNVHSDGYHVHITFSLHGRCDGWCPKASQGRPREGRRQAQAVRLHVLDQLVHDVRGSAHCDYPR